MNSIQFEFLNDDGSSFDGNFMEKGIITQDGASSATNYCCIVFTSSASDSGYNVGTSTSFATTAPSTKPGSNKVSNQVISINVKLEMLKKDATENKTVNKKYKIIVSNAKYRAFVSHIKLDENQTSLVSYFNELSAQNFAIDSLMRENKQLRRELDESSQESTIFKPGFFKKMMEIERKKTAKQKLNYDDEILRVALYYFLIGGKRTYETLSMNFPLPSIALVYKYLYEKKASTEGEFQFEEFAARNVLEGDVKYVWVAEDDTKITEGLCYNVHDDTLWLLLPSRPTERCSDRKLF